MFPFTSTKNQFLGSLLPSTSVKTTTPATTTPTRISNPVVSASPSATGPAPVSPAKSQFIASATSQPSVPPPSPNVTTPSGAVVNKDTGSLVSGPAAPSPEDTYKNVFEQYIKTLSPTSEETAATSFLNNLLLQQKQDQETALGRGETLGFASGEAQRVNKNNAFQIEAASNALNALTTKRTALTDAEKARLDFTKSLLPSKDPFSLSAGETRYDSKGNVIASRPAAPKEPKNKQIIGSADTGYYQLNEDGTATPIRVAGAPSFKDYIAAAQKKMGVPINPGTPEYKQLKDQYDQATRISATSDNEYGL